MKPTQQNSKLVQSIVDSQPSTQRTLFQQKKITGVITKLSFIKSQSTTITINGFQINYSFYCPLRTGDFVHCTVDVSDDGKCYMPVHPYVKIANDKKSTIENFVKGGGISYRKAEMLYSEISTMAEDTDPENIIKFLNDLAQSYNDTYSKDTLSIFEPFLEQYSSRFLKYWYNEKTARKLYVLGMTMEEVRNCHQSCDEIHRTLLVNPYLIVPLSLEKCCAMVKIMGLDISEDAKTAGLLVRTIYNNTISRMWNCTPCAHINNQYQDITPYLDILISDYNVKMEHNAYYLPRVHHIEKTVVDYIKEKIKINKENSSVPIVPYFTKQVSDDQHIAIAGALNNVISIVTGKPGTGKCLGEGTLVLMFDGSVQKVESLKTGDHLMGPDSKSRTILSTTNGKANLYKISPTMGKSFLCNYNHMLTLKSRPATIHMETKTISYYNKGLLCTTLPFNCLADAYAVMAHLANEDIWDMPLYEYLQLPKYMQENCFLYHATVHFQQTTAPISAHLYGGLLALHAYVDTTLRLILIVEIESHKLYAIRSFFKIHNIQYQYHNTLKVWIIQFEENHSHKYHILNDLLSLQNIHKTYKCNDLNTRKSFLLGYVMVASTATSEGNLLIHTEYIEAIANDLVYMALSVGYMAYLSTCNSFIHVSGELVYGDKFATDQYYPLTHLFEVECVGYGTYYGFELNKDGRFLLGDFLVTHNTSCLTQIKDNLNLANEKYVICSYTGRAVARAKEVTKSENVYTIHRLIMLAKKEKSPKFSTLIIDEASMVYMELFYELITHYTSIERIIFVGDHNQLEPQQFGSLFESMCMSSCVPMFKLTTNHRICTTPGELEGILVNADAMLGAKGGIFRFTETENFQIEVGSLKLFSAILVACKNAGIEAKEIGILTPYNKTLPMLNKKFQEIYNSESKYVIDMYGNKWAIYDRVMLTKNNSTLGVANGESGNICEIKQDSIIVDFGISGQHSFLLDCKNGNKANNAYEDEHNYEDEYNQDSHINVSLLSHCFALTIDKSQGGEWDYGILFIPEFNLGSFLSIKRIYTSITRFKKALWCIVPNKEAFNMVASKKPAYRYDYTIKKLKMSSYTNTSTYPSWYGDDDADDGYESDY